MWARDNPDKVRAAQKKYRASHPATTEQLQRRRIKDKNLRALAPKGAWRKKRKWAESNPIKYRAAIKRWESENRDKVNKYRRKWVEANRDKKNEASRRYREKIASQKRVIKIAREASALAAQAGMGRTPWSHLRRTLTQPEWEAQKEWRKQNPDLRFKRGDARKDGCVFLSYHRDRIGGECWGTLAQWETDKKRSALQNKRLPADYIARKSKEARIKRKLRADPDEIQKWRDHHRAYGKKWRTPARVRMYAPRRVPHAQARGHGHAGRNRRAVLALYQKAVDLSAGTSTRYVVDHIIPIKHGGWTHELNLQVMPSRDNFLKQAKAFWISDEYLDFRDVPEFLWPDNLKPVYQLFLRMLGRPLKKNSEAA